LAKVLEEKKSFILMPRSSTNPGFSAASFYPGIENRDQAINIRVVVIGQIVENGLQTGKKVGAFVDMDLKPNNP
jgi:hypothetical protein